MKTLILLIVIFFWANISNAQNVNIPDANFKNALIEAGVDTDENGEINYAEAEAIISLDVSGDEGYFWGEIMTCAENRNIKNLEGIEAFTNLESLNCACNLLETLDLSHNTALTFLECGSNLLETLDVSGNSALSYLWCCANPLTTLDVSGNITLQSLIIADAQLVSLDVSGCTVLEGLLCQRNHLTSLDVSNNTALIDLICGDNLLTSLDLSDNTKLEGISCCENLLTSLDVSNNVALALLDCSQNPLTSLDLSNNGYLEYLYLDSMLSLNEVCVWEMPFPTTSVDVNYNGSPNVYFTTKCSGIMGISSEDKNTVRIYPVPVGNWLTLEFDEFVNPNTRITVYNVSGKKVFAEKIDSSASTHNINLSSLRKGLYLINISNEQYSYTEKVIKVE